MPRPSTRQYRLPQRTDYALIPAPLDLSLPLATEKSALPAIIVTPCSPSSSRDFSIAFLEATPPKQSMRQRLAAFNHFNAPSMRTRSLIVVAIVLFVLMCHLLTHRLATGRTRFELSAQTGDALATGDSLDWFNLKTLFGRDVEAEHVYRDIVGSGALGLH